MKWICLYNRTRVCCHSDIVKSWTTRIERSNPRLNHKIIIVSTPNDMSTFYVYSAQCLEYPKTTTRMRHYARLWTPIWGSPRLYHLTPTSLRYSWKASMISVFNGKRTNSAGSLRKRRRDHTIIKRSIWVRCTRLKRNIFGGNWSMGSHVDTSSEDCWQVCFCRFRSEQ